MRTTRLPKFVQQILAARRKRRINHALSKIATKKDMKIIDIGCGIDGRSFEDFIPQQWEVIGIDVHSNNRINHSHPNFSYVKGDAADLGNFADNMFDLAISIGMLEHITDELLFKSVVSEIRRVAKQYIIIVPYKYALVEPHYGVPFFPILPNSFKLILIKLFNLSNHRDVIKNDPDYVKKNFIWLSNSEYKKHFPEASIYLSPTFDTIAIIHKNESLFGDERLVSPYGNNSPNHPGNLSATDSCT